MRLNFTDHLARSTFIGWFLCAAISDYCKKNNLSVKDHFDKQDDGCIEVKLIVNGIEVPFEQVINRMHEHQSEFLIKESRRLFEEKFNDKFNEIYEELNKGKEYLLDLFEKEITK